MQNWQFRRSSTATSKRRRLICVSSPTKANDTALKRQFPSGDVLAAAISGSKGRSSGTSDIAILSVCKPTWPRSGKVQKNCFSLAYFFYKPRENSKTSLVTVVHAVSILNNSSRSLSLLILNSNQGKWEHVEGVATVGRAQNVVSPQYVLLAKGTFHFTIYNVTFGKSKVADVDIFGS